MASTLLEQSRVTHEEIEWLERLIAKDLQQETRSHREKLYQSHRVKNRVDSILDNSVRLVSCILTFLLRD